jgi:hypothetical protein
MTTLYISKWMSGEETLEYLSGAEPDIRKRIAKVRKAVCDGAVRGRQAGAVAENERQWWEANGLVSEGETARPDRIWRSWFIGCDIATLDIGEFTANSEFLREDVSREFSLGDPPTADTEVRPQATPTTAVPRVRASEMRDFCKRYIADETAAARLPTQGGCVQEAKERGHRWPRDVLRRTFNEEAAQAGSVVSRGRPSKHANSPRDTGNNSPGNSPE